MKNIAAIDIGTNSIHMVIVSINKKKQVSILEKRKKSIMLGSFLNKESHITEKGIIKAIQTLQEMKDTADHYSPHYLIVATHIARISENFLYFQKRVTLETGLNLHFINGEEEAKLSALGIQSKMNIDNEKFLGIDLGGGSTEVFIFQGKQNYYSRSLSLGAVLLSEKFKKYENIEEVETYIKNKISSLSLPKEEWTSSIGCSGTIKALGKIYINTQKQKKTNNHEIPLHEIENIYKKLIQAKKPSVIQKKFNLDIARSESILFGTAILIQILKKLHINSLKICNAGIREGLIVNYLHMNTDNDISIKNIQDKFLINIKKADRVEYFAMKIFHTLHSQLNITNFSSILRKSCQLHCIGKFINHNNHGKHGAYIIKHIVTPTLSENDKLYVSSILNQQHKNTAEDHQPTNHKHNGTTITTLTNILKIAKKLAKILPHQETINIYMEQNHIIISSQETSMDFLIQFNHKNHLIEPSFTQRVKLNQEKNKIHLV
ncbi:MAG: Ppx/GppA phosphatase family protein [Oligoflexales bacterium]